MPNKLVKTWNKAPKWLRNKYSITLMVFLVYMLFFDQNDALSLIEIRGEINELEQNRTYYQERIKETERDLTDLLTNDENLERYAREKYLMKKENEEIFVIVDK